jgi:hypothetical protein
MAVIRPFLMLKNDKIFGSTYYHSFLIQTCLHMNLTLRTTTLDWENILVVLSFKEETERGQTHCPWSQGQLSSRPEALVI